MKLPEIICIFLCAFGTSTGIIQTQFGQPDEFSKTIQSASYVDKSQLIKQVVQHNVMSISVPRRSGKTTNLDMIKRFFEIEVDEDGHVTTSLEKDESGKFVEKKSEEHWTENFKLFRNHNLSIYRDKDFFNNHFGQYPVIYINFQNVNRVTFAGVLEKLRTTLNDAFHHHGYLMNCQQLWAVNGGKFDKEAFKKYWGVIDHKHLTESEIKVGFKFLSEILHARFNKTVMVLIDDLDTPILFTLFSRDSQLQENVRLISEMISELLTAEHVSRGVIHTSVELSKIFWRGVNVTHFPFLQNHKFSEFYGFTENEIKNLAVKFNVAGDVKEIKNWYGGYRISGTHTEMYNVWSVTNYLKEGEFKGYWSNSVGVKNLDKIFVCEYVQFMFNDLLNNRVICIESNDTPKLKDVQDLQHFFNSPPTNEDDYNEKTAFSFVQFLFNLGYFNVVHIRYYHKAMCLEVPNTEIGQELATKFYNLPYFEKRFGLDSEQIHSFSETLNLLSGSKSSFENLSKRLSNLFSRGQISLLENGLELHRMIYAFVKNFPKFQSIHAELYNKNDLDSLVTAIVRHDGTVVIMRVGYNSLSAREMLQQVFIKKQDIVEKYRRVGQSKIFLGLRLHKDRAVSLSYLVNSTDIDRAIDVIS